MSNQPRLGFTPVQGSQWGTRRYTVASAYAPSNSCPGIAAGEVVKRVADGTIAIQNVGDTGNLLGVVASVTYLASDGRKIYNGVLPTGYTYTGDADVINPFAPIIEVWDNPNIEYMAQLLADSGTPLTEFAKNFSNMELTATSSTSVDTYYKRSLRALSGTDATTATLPFRLVEILRNPAQDYSATSYLRVKCVMNVGAHPFYNSTGL